MSVSPATSHLGDPFPLSELMSRFRKEWARRRDDNEEPVTRIASFNLLIVSRGEQDDGLKKIVAGLEDSHPARIIWTHIEPEKAWDDSTARLHLGCRCDGVQVCSEQVQICCGPQPSRVASLILPLIHAGLATHLLWWKAGDLKGPLFERLSDRSQMILVEPNDWETFAAELPYLWDHPEKSEHSFYPLSWFTLTEARQRIASAYGYADVELALPKRTNLTTPDSELLSAWIEALVPTAGRSQAGIRVVSSAEYDAPTLRWEGRELKLQKMNALDAVRQALDRPARDSVFQKMVEILRERDF